MTPLFAVYFTKIINFYCIRKHENILQYIRESTFFLLILKNYYYYYLRLIVNDVIKLNQVEEHCDWLDFCCGIRPVYHGMFE